MAGYIGQLEALDMAGEDQPTYIARLEQHLESNEIPPEKNMLGIVGGKTYSLDHNLIAPEKLANKVF